LCQKARNETRSSAALFCSGKTGTASDFLVLEIGGCPSVLLILTRRNEFVNSVRLGLFPFAA